ncbi:MAG: glycosyltransferase 87 family protein [Micropruina sp.]|uniref:glycosyltransferase 87 family protein n=1 Tax=Micropruina sp. TaxID=2737536 RepID=UPI0039E6B4EC
MWSLLHRALSRRALSRRPLPRHVVGGLIAWSVAGSCAAALGAGSIDLDVYLRAASELAAGRDPNLTPPGHLPWLYPPFAAAVYLPLLTVPFPVAVVAVALTSLAALARVLQLVLDRLAPGRPDLIAVCLAAAVVTEPVASTLGYGQLNIVLAWLVTEGVLGRRRWLIGVAAGLKLTPLVFLLPLLLRRDLRGAAQLLAGFAGTVALGWLLAPAASSGYWTGLVLTAPERIGIGYATNQSLTGAVARAVGPGGSLALTAALSLVVVLATVVVLRRTSDEVLAVAVTGLAGLLLSPISWTHHWIWSLPLVLWCAANGRAALGSAWAILLIVRPTWWYPSGGIVEYSHDPLGKLIQDSWTLLALVTLGLLTARSGSSRAQLVAWRAKRKDPADDDVQLGPHPAAQPAAGSAAVQP